MTRLRSHPGRLLLPALLLLGAIVFAYAGHFDNGFHFDDEHVIVRNTSIRDLGNVPRFFTDATLNSTLPTNRAYRPVLMVTLAFDYWVGDGLDPFFFHLSTFLWFLVQGLLMYFVYLRMLDASDEHRWNPYTALGIVGLYMLHMTNAETINYVCARSDSLSTLCVVAAFAVDRPGSRWRGWLACIPMAIGILIKPPALMFVPLLFLHRLLFARDTGLDHRRVRTGGAAVIQEAVRLVPLAAIGVALFAITMVMQPDTWVPGGTSRSAYLITQPFVLLRYFWLFFVPVGLSADTDWTVLDSILDVRFFAGTLFIVAALAVAGLAARRPSTRPVTFGLLWFFVALAPSSSIIPLSEVTNDHRIFFPYVGLALAVGWGVALLAYRYESALLGSRWRLGLVVGLYVAILTAHVFGVRRRCAVWDNETALWHDVTQKSPRNGRGQMNYGLALMRRGDVVGAEAHFARALDTRYGRHPYLAVNLALVNARLGRAEEAERFYRQSLEGGAQFPEVHYYYAKWLGDQGRLDEARHHLDFVLERSPTHAPSLEYRAELVMTRADRIAAIERRVDREPTRDALIELSLQYYLAGRFDDCVRACRRAIELQPQDVVAFNNICSASIALEQWDVAIEACERALEIDPAFVRAQNNLALARRGREESDERKDDLETSR